MKIIGERALLFTDIEGSTALLQRVGPGFVDLLDQHHRIMREAIDRGGGEEIQSDGDAFVVLFPTTAEAVAAAVDAQQRLREGPWPPGASISVRMGVHRGEIGLSESGYVGMPLHEAARVASAAHGGQILISDAARHALETDRPEDPGVELRDLGQFSLKDIGSHVPLIQIVHPELPDDFPTPRITGSAQNNLPAQLTSFVGRDSEICELDDLIQRHRLVTLSGAGGIGKTRLALQVAANAAPRCPDGVWLIELASLDRGDDIVDEIRRSMRIPDDGGGETGLLSGLLNKHVLLVFDNCEHMLDETAALVDRLTKRCPSVHVLATSREPFGTVGEVTWRVPSLALQEAIGLFTDRAELATPGFELAPRERTIVERICSRLDGIPLAIELAAARVGTIPVDEIEHRLLDQFRLLTVGSRGGVARHQTLKATLEWSYRLLDVPEQTLLRRLAIFRGAPDVEAVEAVCSADVVESAGVVQLLESLHAKSLLTIDSSRRPARVRLSEIVRQFSATLLEATDESALLAENHAAYFLELSSRARMGCLGANRLDWLCRFADDSDNFALAFDWLDEHEPSDAAVLISNTKEWLISSDSRSWLERLRRTAERTDLSPRATAIANGLRSLFAGGYGREPAEVAAVAARRAYENVEAVVDPRERLRVLTNLALGSREADPDVAADLADRAVAEAEALGDDAETAWSLNDLIFVRHEHHPETRRLRAQLLALVDKLGPRWSNVDPLVDAALDAHQVGRVDDALAWLDAAERMLPQYDRHSEVISEDAIVLAVWGVLIRGEIGDTATAILIAEDVLARLGANKPHQAKDVAGTYGQVLMLAGDLDAARTAFEIATDREDGWRYLVFAIASIGLATIDVAEGNAERAYAALERFTEEDRRLWVRARAHDVMAQAALAMGDPPRARSHVESADELRGQNGFVLPPTLRERSEALRGELAGRTG